MTKKLLSIGLIFVLLLTTVWGLAACDTLPDDEIPEYEVAEKYFNAIEQEGYSFLHSGNGFFAETQNAQFYFDKTIIAENRHACIFYTEKILDCILLDTKPEIYLLINYDYYYFDGNKLLTGILEFKTIDYIAAVVVSVFGEYTNYGLAYGYANKISGQLGWGTKTATIPQNPSEIIKDINTLCFSTQFVSEKDVSDAKNLSISFVNDYIAQNSINALETLIDKSNDIDDLSFFNNALGSWYSSKGMSFTAQTVLYSAGGETHDYSARCQYATSYVERDWIDITHGTYEDNILHENYSRIKHYFEEMSWVMGQYQRYFAFDYYDNSLTVLFKNYQLGAYNPELHQFIVHGIGAFVHEYIHSITYPDNLQSLTHWRVEGATYVFDLKYGSYSAIIYSDYMNNVYANQDFKHPFYKTSKALIEYYGRPFDWNTDNIDFMHLYTYFLGAKDPGYKSTDDHYNVGGSFVAYLIEMYGEEATLNYVYKRGEDWISANKAYNELVADWLKYLQDNYSTFN